uniref:Uncharacterized protein n=1 Tax=Cacopsylla melanoneura TaxID=428564 RepID=A0A8D9BBW8_9HEMI
MMNHFQCQGQVGNQLMRDRAPVSLSHIVRLHKQGGRLVNQGNRRNTQREKEMRTHLKNREMIRRYVRKKSKKKSKRNRKTSNISLSDMRHSDKRGIIPSMRELVRPSKLRNNKK